MDRMGGLVMRKAFNVVLMFGGFVLLVLVLLVLGWLIGLLAVATIGSAIIATAVAACIALPVVVFAIALAQIERAKQARLSYPDPHSQAYGDVPGRGK
jgi:hypothetical protein